MYYNSGQQELYRCLYIAISYYNIIMRSIQLIVWPKKCTIVLMSNSLNRSHLLLSLYYNILLYRLGCIK